MVDHPLLSIVVTSYTLDRLQDIFELLDNIKAQTYARTETILVVERSKELLHEIQRYVDGRAVPNVKLVFNSGEPGLSAARNLGFKESRGDIIAFIDDDAVPFTDWAAELVKTYADESILGSTGPVLPLWQDESVDWFPDEFDWILSCSGFSGITGMTEVRNVWGTNMSFRREAFKLAGVFSTSLGAKGGGKSGKHELVGDETEFSIRLTRKTGKRLVCNPKSRVRHKVYKYRITPKWIARRAYWEGYTKALFNRIYSDVNEEKLLRVEYQLLGRIAGGLLPDILKEAPRHPVVAWRKAWVTVVALSFVAIGYFSYKMPSPFSGRKPVIF